MTADIIHLQSLRHDAPAPEAKKPLRCFIFEMENPQRDLAKYSQYTVNKARWSVAKALTSNSYELWTAFFALKLDHAKPLDKEDCEYALFQFYHEKGIGWVWGVAARLPGGHGPWIIATRKNLHRYRVRPGPWDVSISDANAPMTGILADDTYIWTRDEGFMGPWAKFEAIQ